MSVLPDGLQPVTDARAAMSAIGDIVQRGNARDPEGWRVRTMAPGDHQAYVRILHPAWENESRNAHIPWSSIAAGSGARLEGTVSFRRITVAPGAPIPPGPQGAWHEDATPLMGTLPEEQTIVLLDLLPADQTCWFLLWNGWEGLRLDDQQVTVNWQGNPHLVFRGPVEAVRDFDWTGRWQTPHVWLTEDRSWCVSTDIDGLETYVAGTQGLIEAIESEPRLETLIVNPEDIAVIVGDWLSTD